MAALWRRALPPWSSMVSRRSRGWVPYLAVGLIIKLDDQKARMITYTYLTRPRHHFGISLTPPKPSLKAHNDRPISHDVRSGSTKMHSSRIWAAAWAVPCRKGTLTIRTYILRLYISSYTRYLASQSKMPSKRSRLTYWVIDNVELATIPRGALQSALLGRACPLTCLFTRHRALP